MNETSKASSRRQADWKFVNRYFVGDGIDIGCGEDPLDPEWFPLMHCVQRFDQEDGDANKIDEFLPAESFDFVYASNVLEHMDDPMDALRRWLTILRSGGHMIVTVPDEDIYEQEVFPSLWNDGHKHTFTISKNGSSWSPVSINVMDLLTQGMEGIRIKKVELVDNFYDYRKSASHPRIDQTFPEDGAEAFIEFVIQKE